MILPKPTNRPPMPEVKLPKMLESPEEYGVWEWIHADIYKCTKCNKYTSVDENKKKQPLYKFCPFCGNKMLSERQAYHMTNKICKNCVKFKNNWCYYFDYGVDDYNNCGAFFLRKDKTYEETQ